MRTDTFVISYRTIIDMMISTVSIAEYCIGGDIDELPLKDLQIVPFNLNHARQTGEFAKIAFRARNTGTLKGNERKIIPNDTKLFAQDDCKKSIEFYLSPDQESLKITIVRLKIFKLG